MDSRQTNPTRRSFLRAASVTGLATMGGCSVQVGGYEISVGQRDSTEGDQPNPEEDTTPTPTSAGTQTADIPPVEVEPLPTVSTPTNSENETIEYKMHNFKLHVARADDAALDRPKWAELYGIMKIRSGLTEEQRAWAIERIQAIEIEEGNRKQIPSSPAYFEVSKEIEESGVDQVVVVGELIEQDKGANQNDLLLAPPRRYALQDLPGGYRHGPFGDGSKTEVYVEYEFSKA